MELSIIIVSYNVKYFVEQCLASVEAAVKNIAAEIIVVDNASRDGSIEYLQQRFSAVQFIANKENIGFAKANNLALPYCRGDYVLFLNPDTIIPEDILQHCISFFSREQNTGAVAVQMIDGSGNFLPESKRSFPSPLVSFFKLSGLSALFPRSATFNKYALGNLDKDKIHEVEVLCGAFMMVEKKLLLQLKGFDESFFMYAEDIDLCYRIQQQGKKIFYLGNEVIVHFKGESSRQKNAKYVVIFYKAMIVFVNKHYRGLTAVLLKLFLYAGIFLRGLVSMIASPLRSAFKNEGEFGIRHKNVYVTGDANSIEEARTILQQTVTAGILQTDEPGTLSDSDIVFCTGTLTYSAAIAIMKDNKDNNHFAWHGLHTRSIVTSSDKKTSGEVYHL